MMRRPAGGNSWAGTYLDTFRYLDQMGRLARQEHDVVFHNTLVASDYSLLDETTLTPKPSYWGALLWRRLMGTTVLDSRVSIALGQHVYAHCLRGVPGGVALLAINNDPRRSRQLDIASSGRRYTLRAKELQSKSVELNGSTLEIGANNVLPQMNGQTTTAGSITLEPATITFLSLDRADNVACRGGS